MDTSEHCKEVYAYFGLAMYRAQCVEQSIVQLLIFFDFFTKNVPTFTTHDKWEVEFDKFDKVLSEKTMGQLLGLIRKLELLDGNIEIMLSTTLKKRNWLAHSFFVDHAVDFINKNGRDQMIRELNDSIELFNSIEDILNPIARNAALKYGLTDELLDKIQSELCKSSTSDY
ncbi:hypothetical protein ABFO89_002028 [Enterobacter hormaechei]|uniref:hypothetical protein n=1 Tax=Enterobacter hormaechei TaxID=158836 RepID=UPI0009B1BEA6|nr:hypothetical protein [Enterobacter hormaechei]EHN8912880.1 hypothetical protein [Enterobacter hormaechei]ELC6387918.1 hypothetical protein [Enterobacter hormaechei]